VTIDPGAPLPGPVIEAVTAKAAPSARAANTTDADATSAAYKVLLSTLDAEAASTGRGIIVVYTIPSAGVGMVWMSGASGTKQAPFMSSPDKAALVATATEWASARGYELIVL
jgi:hypothetical protein